MVRTGEELGEDSTESSLNEEVQAPNQQEVIEMPSKANLESVETALSNAATAADIAVAEVAEEITGPAAHAESALVETELTPGQQLMLEEGFSLRDVLRAGGVEPNDQRGGLFNDVDWVETGTTALKYTLGAAVVVAIAYGGYKLLTSGSEAAPE